MPELNASLKPFLPEASHVLVQRWLSRSPIFIKVTYSRVTKYGDYFQPTSAKPYHKISVNHNLNPYSFLITLTHEYAHLVCFAEFGNRVQPHGEEWQNHYRQLLRELIAAQVFPDDIAVEIVRMIHGTVHASASAEKKLQLALRNYDSPQEKETLLLHIPENALFRLHDEKVFRKGSKIRTRYKCLCVTNNRWYFVNETAPVKLVTIHTAETR